MSEESKTADFERALTRSATIVRPTHALLVGAASVNIPLNGHRTVDPRAIPAYYHALFAVHVSRALTKEELIALSTWMRKMPSFAGLKIVLLLLLSLQKKIEHPLQIYEGYLMSARFIL